MKQLFFWYQKVMWYAAQSKGEYAKVGSFIPEAISLVTLLTVRGVRIPLWQIPIFYLLLLVVAALVGKVLVILGVARYNNTLANTQNAELQEILKTIKAMKP